MSDARKLTISYVFPGAIDYLVIHTNMPMCTGEIGTLMIPLVLRDKLMSVEGIDHSSRWTGARGSYGITVGVRLDFTRDDVLLDIATTLAEYFGVEDTNVDITQVIDDRPLRWNRVFN